VKIKNCGLLSQNQFTLKLKKRENIELATYNIEMLILPNETKTITVNWTPPSNGIYFLYFEVLLPSDENQYNNCSSYLGVFVTTLQQPKVFLKIDSNTNIFTLSWDAVSGANSYKVYSSSTPNSSDWGEPIIVTNKLSYSNHTSTKHFFRVVASTDSPFLSIENNEFNEEASNASYTH
jgi:hypothetical protein